MAIATTVPFSSETRRPTDWVAYLFVAFFTVPFFVFNILPILFGFYVSFTKWGVFGAPRWIGLDNYREALNDDFVATAFKNTILYGFVIVPAVMLLGLAAALYVNQKWPLSTLVRICFFSPYVVSATVIGLIWVWMLDTQFGVINHYLGYIGLHDLPWLTSTSFALYGVSIASVWWDMGLAFVLFLAALQDIPTELYDAAEVDGATRTQQLWHVTLPHLRSAISTVATLQLISTMRIFSQVYVMTSGGPASSSSSVLYHIYTLAIRNQRFGLAAALSMLLFAMILVITLINRLLVRET